MPLFQRKMVGRDDYKIVITRIKLFLILFETVWKRGSDSQMVHDASTTTDNETYPPGRDH